jgi:Cu(I)/Ag(I) efflux system membrane protein CusA/SilA
MVGGVITSFVLELLIYPVIFTIWKWRREVRPTLESSAEVAHA